MGFSYVGRALCCDFCGGFTGDAKGTIQVRKMPCPYGYCQAWATCHGCRLKGTHKKIASVEFGNKELNKNHEGCHIEMVKVGGVKV